MTCASCANRIERKLNKLDGVTASVNYATEQARVEHSPDFEVQTLLDTGRGRGLQRLGPAAARAEEDTAEPADPTRPLRDRLVISAVLGLPVLVLSMVPPLQFENWQWLVLALAAPVVVWGGLPVPPAAWTNLRHGAATMDTLISIGTLAAFLWSLYALFFGGAGMIGHAAPRSS
jgi:Cu+-exporting ATPase